MWTTGKFWPACKWSKACTARCKSHHHKGNDSNTTNSKEISVEIIKSNGQCSISRELNCQSESNCDDYMLLNWALMHKVEHCQNLDTSNWENVQILNNDHRWLSKPGTTYRSSGEGTWYAYPIRTFFWRHPLSSTVANTMQRAALNFDLTLKGCYYVFKIYNNRVIFYNNAKFILGKMPLHKHQMKLCHCPHKNVSGP